LLYGIPYPGVYITNEEGTVVAKFFHDSYKQRESPELYIDAVLGQRNLDENVPQVSGGDQDINLTIAAHGGNGTVRQGIVRHLVVRFELPEGLHIYGPPVPDGMIVIQVTIEGPRGFALMSPEFPATEKLTLPGIAELNVWHGTVDLVYPFFATGELASECRPLDVPSIDIKGSVRHQACTDRECLLPKTENFTLSLDLDVIDLPAIDLHMGHGQREGNYDGSIALERLLGRKINQNTLGLPIFLAKTMGLQMGALLRKLQQRK
jgi:DsbC/DsbD-like thiol-disulfide interchange protein